MVLHSDLILRRAAFGRILLLMPCIYDRITNGGRKSSLLSICFLRCRSLDEVLFEHDDVLKILGYLLLCELHLLTGQCLCQLLRCLHHCIWRDNCRTFVL